jgi:RNA polymerase sigma-70 factor (ECF subfamily)
MKRSFAVSEGDAPQSGGWDETRRRSAVAAADSAAMRRLAGGDNSAFNEIYARYRSDVFSFLCRLTQNVHLADDILQTTFLRVLQSPGGYDDRWPLKTWLLGIARNAFIDWTRKTRREVDPAALMGGEPDSNAGDSAPAHWNPPAPAEGGIDQLIGEEEQSRLEQAINRLPWPQREAILLVKVAGLPIREAAKVIAGTEGMVKMRLRRGLLRLMELLGAENGAR